MRNNTPNRRNTSKNKIRWATSNPKSHGRDSAPLNAGMGQAANSAAKVTEEAVDVLAFVGFKL